jgi:uncharacterized protein
MQRFRGRITLVGVSLLLISGSAYALTAGAALRVDQVPNPRQANGGWVTDQANVLSSGAEEEINRRISALEAKNGSEIAVVTLPKLPSKTTAKEFTTALFNHWGIGKKGQDNGVLFLISIGDRRTEIETGYGAEALLPDARVGRILDRKVIPYFKQGNYEKGIQEGTVALVSVLEKGSSNTLLSSATEIPGYLQASLWGGSILALVSFLLQRFNAKKPLFIEPEGYTRVEGFDPTNRPACILVFLVIIGILLILLVIAGIVIELSGEAFFLAMIILYAVYFAIASSGCLRSLIGTHALRPIHCKRCGKAMELLPEPRVAALLTESERTAALAHSVEFDGLWCSTCFPSGAAQQQARYSQEPTEGFHLRAYVAVPHIKEECPHCKELTMNCSSRVVRHASLVSDGLRVTTKTCQCCGYKTEREELIPHISTSDGGGSSGGGGFDGGGFSGGGGSFGGGSSGGGGAGRDW